jgi:hypothetical protein
MLMSSWEVFLHSTSVRVAAAKEAFAGVLNMDALLLAVPVSSDWPAALAPSAAPSPTDLDHDTRLLLVVGLHFAS